MNGQALKDQARPIGKLTPRDDRAKIVHYLLTNQDRTATQIVDGTGIPMDTVRRIVKALKKTGHIKVTGGTTSRTTYSAVRHADKTRQLAQQSYVKNHNTMAARVKVLGDRERIRKAINADPDQLTTRNLAGMFGLLKPDAEAHVATLLKQGEIAPGPRSTFHRATTSRLP